MRMLVERLGQSSSCSTIHSDVFYVSGDPKPFPIWDPFSAFALHWRFSRRSMSSATWPSLIRDPWCFLPKRVWYMFCQFEGIGQVYHYHFGMISILLSVLQKLPKRHMQDSPRRRNHWGTLWYTWRICQKNSSRSKFTGLSFRFP